MSDSVRPHRQQPTRLRSPLDSPGKNTGCHFLLQCMKVKSESEVAQSCLTLSDPMDCSPPGFSIHGICQARVLEWGAVDSRLGKGFSVLALLTFWTEQFFVVGLSGIVGCLAASLACTDHMPVVTTKNISRHGQMFPRGQDCSLVKTTFRII